MTRVSAAIGAIALFSSAVFGQAADPAPAFRLADVHPSPHAMNPFMRGGVLRGGRYEVHTASMVDLISAAYGVTQDKVLSGPSWLESDRFEISAKAPADTSPETLKLMLQNLLAERFKLVISQDSKPLPVFILSQGKGKHKLKEADSSGMPGCQGVPQQPQPGTIPMADVICHNVTMERFATELRNMAGAYMTATVVDQTNLKGNWDLEIRWHARALLSMAGADAVTIFDAVDKQLGLHLDAGKLPNPVIIVTSVNRTPTDNPPGVTTSLPPVPPAEFEVAEIKPSQPGVQPMGRIQNGRVDAQGIPLKQLIMIAWEINEDLLAGAPKWMDSATFSIVAKASTGSGGQIDDVSLRQMLRALLIERFNMKTHMEDRPVNSYTLVAVKPKLKKADPLNRTACKEGAPPEVKDPRNSNPILNRFLNCTNMTMAEFADRLPQLASGYIHTPVLDSTGIEGAYDFTLNFSGIGLLNGGPGRGGDGAAAAAQQGSASDPNGAISLFDAVKNQLGLRLDQQKRPQPVLVIDHIDEKPTDN